MKLFKNILYLAEPGLDQTTALARAVSLAENNQARLILLQVSEPPRAGILAESDTLEACAVELRERMAASLEAMVAPWREVIPTRARPTRGARTKRLRTAPVCEPRIPLGTAAIGWRTVARRKVILDLGPRAYCA